MYVFLSFSLQVAYEYVFQVFLAHRMKLTRSSEVFQVMFYGGLSEKDVIRVTDVTPAAFQALLT
jgi:hypothetical protein